MRFKRGMRKRVLGILLSAMMVLTGIPSSVQAVEDNGSKETIGIRNTDFLKADGKLVRKNYGTGEVVYLRGTNAGGYLLQEFWMCLTEYTANVSCEMELYNKLTERFGTKTTQELVNYYQDIYWTEEDFDRCADLGMNCIRLPIWYRNLVDADGKFLNNAWDRMDWFIENAGKRGIYVILDMHGAPGSQNGSDHSGVDGRENKEGASKFFWGNNATANQNLYYTIWENIARRYKDNPIVAGYDLLNEPYCTYRYSSSKSEKELRNLLWGIYDKAYDKIRAIDSNHMIIMEATWEPWDLPDPSTYNWSNVMYEYHNYLYDDYNNDKGQQIANMKKKTDAIAQVNYNVPSYMGEFNYMDNPNAWKEGLQLLNDNNLHWTIWTYKTVGSSNNWGTFHHASDHKVNIETDSVDTIKSKWAKAATSSENTKLTAAIKGYFSGVNKTTQYVNIEDGEYYLTVNNKVVKAPDSGKSPLAAVSNSYSGNAEKLTFINNADGTISLKSGANGKYVCAVIDENNQLLARSDKIEAWEKFYAVRINDSQIGLLSCANGRYVKGDFNNGQGSVLKAANDSIGGAWEAFTIKKTNGESVDLGNGTQRDDTDAGSNQEGNILANPTFEKGTEGWTTFKDETAEVTFQKDGNAGLDIDIKNPGKRDWSVQIFQEKLHLIEGKKYEITVDLVSTKDRSVITALQNYNAATESAKDYGSKTTALKANQRTRIQLTTDTIRTDVIAGKLYIGLGQVSGNDKACKITIYSVNVVPIDGATAGEDKDYSKLVWSDEFEGNKLDTNTWVYEKGNGDSGWGNGESQYYTERGENLSVENGMLKITARREKYEGFQYTSARIKTQGKKSFQYGKIEARIKMDEGQGHWPAFWMLGDSISNEGWPKCGEIDIMEWSSKWDYSVGTLHWADAGGNHQYSTGYTHTSSIGSIDTSEWHTYAIEWDEKAIRFLCDGIRYHYVNIEGEDFTEFHKKHFILLNVAVGGNFTNYTVDDKIFPRSMYVDYVRVYEVGEPLEVKVAEINPSEEQVSLKEGESRKIQVEVLPDKATNKGLSYASNDVDVAIVSANGTITAVGEGNTTITIATQDGSKVTATIDVTVTKETISGSGGGDESGGGAGNGSEAGEETRPGGGAGSGGEAGEETRPGGGAGSGGEAGEETRPGAGDGVGSGSEAEEETKPGTGDGVGSGSEAGTETKPGTGDGVGSGSEVGGGTKPGEGTGSGSEAGTTPEGGSGNTQVTNPSTIQIGTTFRSGKFNYKITKATDNVYTAELLSPTKKTLQVVKIPKTVKYHKIVFKVTSIEKQAFQNNKKLKKIVIGSNVTKIGTKAFAGCRKLKSVQMNTSKLKSIGKYAFRSIHKQAIIKVPAKKLKSYKKLLKKAKLAAAIKVKGK